RYDLCHETCRTGGDSQSSRSSAVPAKITVLLLVLGKRVWIDGLGFAANLPRPFVGLRAASRTYVDISAKHIARKAISRGGMTQLNVRPLAYAVGAEITGLDLTKPLPDDTISEIRRTLLETVVLCIPGQNLSEQQMVAFCA